MYINDRKKVEYNNIMEKVECIVCYETKDSNKMRCCGQELCKDCIIKLKEKRCPLCRKTLEGDRVNKNNVIMYENIYNNYNPFEQRQYFGMYVSSFMPPL